MSAYGNSPIPHTAFILADQFVKREARGFRITNPAHNSSARTPINTSTILLQHFTAQLLNPRVCLIHSESHNMGKYCCVVGCTADERKFAKMEKFPWMRDVTFWPFSVCCSCKDCPLHLDTCSAKGWFLASKPPDKDLFKTLPWCHGYYGG